MYSVGDLCGLVVRDPGYRSRGPGSDSLRYLIFWEVVGLGRGPLNLVSTIEELLERKSSSSGLEKPRLRPRVPPRWRRDTPLSAKVGINFADKRRSLGRVRSRTQATEFLFTQPEETMHYESPKCSDSSFIILTVR
jgi:hypothetical protein